MFLICEQWGLNFQNILTSGLRYQNCKIIWLKFRV